MTSLQVDGVRLAVAAAGVRYQGRDDLVLVELAPGTHCAAVFTRNAFCAAPVTIARQHLAERPPRYWLINSGNANAGTGERGPADARACCRELAALGAVAETEVLPFSTGVIGEYLPTERILDALPALLAGLSADAWEPAAQAIMTTDTVPKLAVRRVQFGGRTATLVGMAKGSGMICPDMATMLAFIATDAAVEPALLRASLQQAVAGSFNAITVDGDTSTNDACVVAATGRLGNAPLAWPEQPESRAFQHALSELCVELATAIVRDGEGATKLVYVEVCDAASVREARQVAQTVAQSPLVKTALFAGDPNWGRILAAVGRAGLQGLAIEGVSIWLDDVRIVSSGGRDPAYTEAQGQQVMAQSAFRIRVSLNRGSAAATIITCDFSYDYVRINAEYRS